MVKIMRTGLATALVAVALLAPLAMAQHAGLTASDLRSLFVLGLIDAMNSIGWVLVPQILLAVAVGGLAAEHLVGAFAGAAPRATPRWLGPALESALLLGMLGTLSGMVRGFTGLSPEELEPGPLVHGLGTALRSSFAGFTIALVGVWVRSAGTDPAEASGGTNA